MDLDLALEDSIDLDVIGIVVACVLQAVRQGRNQPCSDTSQESEAR